MFLCNSTIIPKKACDLVGLKYNQVMKVMLIAVAIFAFTAAVWAQDVHNEEFPCLYAEFIFLAIAYWN
jgi:hypothetical protein